VISLLRPQETLFIAEDSGSEDISANCSAFWAEALQNKRRRFTAFGSGSLKRAATYFCIWIEMNLGNHFYRMLIHKATLKNRFFIQTLRCENKFNSQHISYMHPKGTSFRAPSG
jgi:hypothetical protein